MYLHKIKLSLCAALLVATLGGCKDSDQPDPSRHVSKAEAKEMTSFDRWLKENYTDAYNVSYIYTLDDIEADRSRNLAPAKLENSMKLAKIIQHA